MRLLKSYAALSGRDTTEIASELGTSVDTVFESKLKSLIAESLGIKTNEFQPKRSSVFPARSNSEDVAFLGDIEDPEDIPPTEEIFFTGGLTDKDLDDDMLVDDPDTEAKAGPLDSVLPSDTGSDILAEAVGYTDHRIEKRKKRFNKGRASVKALTSSVEAEGAGV